MAIAWLKEHSNYLNSFGQRLKLSMISEADGEKIFPFWPWPNTKYLCYDYDRKPFSIPNTQTGTGAISRIFLFLNTMNLSFRDISSQYLARLACDGPRLSLAHDAPQCRPGPQTQRQRGQSKDDLGQLLQSPGPGRGGAAGGEAEGEHQVAGDEGVRQQSAAGVPGALLQGPQQPGPAQAAPGARPRQRGAVLHGHVPPVRGP